MRALSTFHRACLLVALPWWFQRDAVMVIGTRNDGKSGILKKVDGKDGIVKYAGGQDRDVVPMQVSRCR